MGVRPSKFPMGEGNWRKGEALQKIDGTYTENGYCLVH